MKSVSCFAALLLSVAMIACSGGRSLVLRSAARSPNPTASATAAAPARHNEASAGAHVAEPVPGHPELERACDAGNAGACLNLGVMFQNMGTELAAVRAADLYERACSLRSAQGCNNLAVMFEKGDGRPQDSGKAFALYSTCCLVGHAIACRNVGRFYRDGIGTGRDEQKANAAFTKAADLSKVMCDAGRSEGCSNLGFMYRNGDEGLPKDEDLAIHFLQRACDLGYVAVCGRVHPSE